MTPTQEQLVQRIRVLIVAAQKHGDLLVRIAPPSGSQFSPAP